MSECFVNYYMFWSCTSAVFFGLAILIPGLGPFVFLISERIRRERNE